MSQNITKFIKNLESELFGHQKGTYTVDATPCIGKFEEANGVSEDINLSKSTY